jgi:hypothetical protein
VDGTGTVSGPFLCVLAFSRMMMTGSSSVAEVLVLGGHSWVFSHCFVGAFASMSSHYSRKLWLIAGS